VMDCASSVANSLSSLSRSAVMASSAASSLRCSPSLRRGHTSPSSQQAARRPSTSPCDGGLLLRLPDVVQLPSAVCAGRHHQRRRGFLIDEILRPDFGRRQPESASPSPTMSPVNSTDQHHKQSPVDVGVNRSVTSIWQPFVASPSDTAVVRQRSATGNDDLPRIPVETRGDVSRSKKSNKRKSIRSSSDVGVKAASHCAVDEASRHHQGVFAAGRSPSRSTASPSGSSSPCSSHTADVMRTESAVEVITTATTRGGTVTKFAQNSLPAWVYCTRYSDRPSSGMHC